MYIGAQSIFMTVWAADAHAHVQKLVSVNKMATLLQGCTTEEQRSVVRLFVGKISLQRIFIKKRFLFTAGRVSRVKRFTTGSRNFLKDVRKSQMMPDQVRKWLRQWSKDFLFCGFRSTGKRWDKCIIVGGIFVEKQMFFPLVRISHILRFRSICDLLTDAPSC
jgi:hypothetical protein